MFSNAYAPSVADIAAVTNGNCNGNGYGWGNDWWAWIILLCLFGGFGNRGYGFGGFSGGNSCCTPATCAEVQNGFNQQATTQALNGITNGISSLGYDNAMIGNNIINAINQSNVSAMQNSNALATQLSNCCCETREAIQGVNYNMSQSFCNLGNVINQAVQTITQNDNANFRALHDELVSYRMQDKDDTIAELRSQVQALNLGVSQRNQTADIVNQIRPCPVPAYTVSNPYVYQGCNQSCCNTCC